MVDGGVPAGIPAPGIEVIGAGFGRTATASLKQALEVLGFGPCDHMHENFDHPERFALWSEALRRKDAGEPIDWRPLLADYRAVVDWPGAHFWRELASAHPQAKVILTVRDPDRWCDSIQPRFSRCSAPRRDRGRAASRRHHPGPHLRAPDRRPRARHGGLRRAQPGCPRGARPGPAPGLRRQGGWEPLCAFLGVPVPDGEAFPHLNDTAEFKADERKRIE